MTSIHHHGVSSEFPSPSPLRSSDRELILVQLMTSVWETILQLPILARDGHDGELTEGEVQDAWGELRVRLTVLQPRR
jgi:hypothetical protein